MKLPIVGLSATAPRKITIDVETPRRQTMLFSATFADDVSDLATWITRRAVEVRVGMKDPLRANKDVSLGPRLTYMRGGGWGEAKRSCRRGSVV